jgi:hypothetical protein
MNSNESRAEMMIDDEKNRDGAQAIKKSDLVWRCMP